MSLSLLSRRVLFESCKNQRILAASSASSSSSSSSSSSVFHFPFQFQQQQERQRVEIRTKQQVRTMKVYTRTGDKGTSQLFNGERRDKDDSVFQALGSIDECNAMIGLACEHVLDVKTGQGEQDLINDLENVMSRLFDCGANVATPLDKSSDAKKKRSSFHPSNVETLEKRIDTMDLELPPLTTFILPSGGKCAATLHVARTLARRAERQVVPLVRQGQVDPEVGKYLNRLSDYLFVSARYIAMKQGKVERTWSKFSLVEEEEEEQEQQQQQETEKEK